MDWFESTLKQFYPDNNDAQMLIKNSENNICPECNFTMTINIDTDEYSCSSCGNILIGVGSSHGAITHCSDLLRFQNEGRIKIRTNNAKHYSDYQKKVIMVQLQKCAEDYTGDPIPQNILDTVCNTYNAIQRLNIIKRSDTKNELLAAILYYVCRDTEHIRKKHNICEFIKLRKYGFSNGEKHLRSLCVLGRIDMNIFNESNVCSNLIKRYAAKLEYDTKYAEFAIKMVERSDKYNICVSILLTTKIAYFLWLVRNAFYKSIPQDQFEKVVECLNTASNKVNKELVGFKHLFDDIANEYSIAL